MDKRLAKRHKRQVERERAKVRTSEPDLRTPEQIEAAREKSRADFGHANQGGGKTSAPTRSMRSISTGSAAKTDG